MDDQDIQRRSEATVAFERSLESLVLERVATALHHVHLPKLADANVVAYEREIGRVERLPAAAQLDPFLELVDDEN
ncbi:DUF7344 domain-containing protein [Natronosalvus caseinilyticus]|uniref:DUF7344 domain-containing protein n=1 Tax=Natronosalvus caseinilyticus TaxID=2953747 RepID=UPI0028AE5B1C|nr:hypothetical protein [Natronosalvus caseinilyticus]